MQTFNYPFDPSRRLSIAGYGVAVLTVAAALICTLEMEARWQASSPVAMLLLAVIVTTRLGGPRPAALASALALVGFGYFVLPLEGGRASETIQVVRLLTLALVTGYVVWVTVTQRSAADSLRLAHDELRLNNEALRRENLERRRTGELLRASETKFRAVAESAPAAILIYQDGRIRYANPAATAITGYSAAELYDMDQLQAVAPGLLELLSGRGLAQPPGRMANVGDELPFLAKAGDERWLGFTAGAFEFEGKPAVVAVACDVTARRRAEEALQDSASHLQQLSRRLLAVQEEERRHLSRDLHDEFGQLIASVTMHLGAARDQAQGAVRARLDESIALLQRAGAQLRSLLLELRPTMLESAGLTATLRWLARQYRERSDIIIGVAGDTGELPAPLAIVCFRVAQEALTNVIRHAQAKHVWIELRRGHGRVELEVRDDGMGFDVARTLERAGDRGYLGLLGMRERVEIAGGELLIDSAPGRGTRISVTLPLTGPATHT